MKRVNFSKSKSKSKSFRAKSNDNSKSKSQTKKKKSYENYHKTDPFVTERDLIVHLNEDLQEAWQKLRDFGSSLGEQRIYASHNSIMFSKKVCYFFVRPKKKYLEVCFFLSREVPGLKSQRAAKTTEKYYNLFKLVHSDQVEEPLTDWIREAYQFAPE
ncbi:MAG: hypothetical protein KDD22_05075 [Bdellovibrionales bacterium]|nr:hypothetical protein [Bdellovibrionales bacterium]